MKKFLQHDVLMLIVVAVLLAFFSTIYAEGQKETETIDSPCEECFTN